MDLQNVQEKLEKRGYAVTRFETAQEAAAHLLSVIPQQATVGIGGSMTIRELNIEEALKARGNEVFWHWSVPGDEVNPTRRKAAVSDVYLCSTNAMTEDGRMINIDGYCNRLAAMLHGTGKVYMVVGRNKIAETLDAAMDRVKNVACPANARRLGLKTPCAVVGHCTDCSSPQRMCAATLILERRPGAHPFEIVLVDEDLGY